MQPFFFCNDSRYRSSKIRASNSGGFVKRKLFMLLLNLLLVLPISAQRTSHSTTTTRQRSTTTTSKTKSSNRSAYCTNRSGHRVHRHPPLFQQEPRLNVRMAAIASVSTGEAPAPIMVGLAGG